ncbi:MAG: peptide deformylase [Bacteroidales bacterium]|jgi:peptide deformylase|nr:peptide deformylase [Bacteroidales bacterium]MDD4214373.1 peptide deformylase [Bacteroidales bacterium]
MKIKNKFSFLLLLLFAATLFAQCKKETFDDPDVPPIDELAFTDAEKAVIFNGAMDSIMRVMNYFIYEDSLILRAQSIDVNLNDTTTLFFLIDRMKVTVLDEGGVGIAAPQVGINRNIIWVQRHDKGTMYNRPWEVFLNPVITKYSDTTEWRSDGCLSIPGIQQNSLRAIWVDVEYDLPDGTHKAERITQKYTAHIFQHEIDHLNGIVFLDRI